jgi:four helix bundle protein
MAWAATLAVPDVVEDKAGQSDPEHCRFVSMALRSCLETVACFDSAERRQCMSGCDLQPVRESGHQLSVKLQALRRSLGEPKTEDR